MIPIAGHDLSALGDAFTKKEVKAVFFALPSDKARGPDGFNEKFFKDCWDIIEDDIMLMINNFSDLNAENFHWLNSSNVTLIPKKNCTEGISDFSLIRLICVVAKLIAKILAMRLALHMNDIVSIAQSAFIKRRSIHDYFMYVRYVARRFYHIKIHMLLFKHHIKKTLDSIRWDYFIDMLSHHGFQGHYWGWISTLPS